MFRVEKLKSELVRRLTTEFHKNSVKIVDNSDPKNYCILPEQLSKEHLEDIKSMKVYEDDVWIITFPKCGTTWTQEMVWLIANNLAFKEALENDLDHRVPFLELEGLLSESEMKIPTFQIVQNMSRPRLIKTHLPAFLLPDEIWKVKPKIIYVVRNPKDTALSYYHHHTNLHVWHDPDIDIFINAFVSDKVPWSPFNDHVLKFYEMHNEPNVLFLHFEDMKRDLKEVVQKVSSFLGKSYSSEEFDKLCDHLSFDKMKDNRAANKADMLQVMWKMNGIEDKNFNFIRKGKVGSHKEELTSEQIEMLDSYVKQIDSDITDFKYKFQ